MEFSFTAGGNVSQCNPSGNLCYYLIMLKTCIPDGRKIPEDLILLHCGQKR